MMKDKIKYLIKILGDGIDELVIDMVVDGFIFNTISIEDDDIYLHVFNDELDFIFDFDELSEKDQSEIYTILYNIRLESI